MTWINFSSFQITTNEFFDNLNLREKGATREEDTIRRKKCVDAVGRLSLTNFP